METLTSTAGQRAKIPYKWSTSDDSPEDEEKAQYQLLNKWRERHRRVSRQTNEKARQTDIETGKRIIEPSQPRTNNTAAETHIKTKGQ